MNKFLILSLTVGLIYFPQKANAQKPNTGYIQNNNAKQQQGYKDQNGNIYYLDQQGKPYYIDNNGYAYYLDLQGRPYYIDQDGYAYYLDEQGKPYYIDKYGYAYYLDKQGKPYYIDKYGYAYYVDKQGKPYYIDQSSTYNDNYYQPANNYPKTKVETTTGPPQKSQYNTNTENTNSYTNRSYNDKGTQKEDYEKFRAAIGGGYSYRLGQGDASLKNAFNIEAEGAWFFNKSGGVGINASYVRNNISSLNYNQTLLYVGPSYITRYVQDKFSSLFNIGLGPLFVTESVSYSPYNISYSKVIPGMNAGVSGEYKISNNLGLGLRFSVTFGTYTYTDGGYNTGEKISASSLSITGFISFSSK